MKNRMSDLTEQKTRRHRGDIMSPEKRSAVMARIRGKDTGPEQMVASALSTHGLEWEGHAGDLPGRPDFVFREQRLAVFVDGDFWHGWRFPQWRDKLSEKWEAKIEGNRHRDGRNHRRLKRMGWKVVRLWEHKVLADVDACVVRVVQALKESSSEFALDEKPKNAGGTVKPRVLDLFCGGGGSSWGARKAGADIVCAVDAWPTATETYRANFPAAHVIDAALDENSSPSLLGDIGDIDMILASPECTNHTCAKGSRPREEASRRTAYYVIKFAKRLTPRWIVLENVVQMRSWRGYNRLIRDLEAIGYNVSPQILEAFEFGVPQTRRRLFLLCDREIMPAEVESSVKRRRRGRTAADVIKFNGPWKSRPLYSADRAPDTLVRAERAIKELGKGQPFLIVYYGSDGSGGWQPIDRPLRTLTTLDRFGLVTWRNRIPRLRMLQVPELMRAMGFDKKYNLLHGSRRDRIKILGNGVCPPVMEAVVRSLTQRA